MFGHLGVAQLLSAPEIALTDAEAEAYTASVTEFLRWHAPSLQFTGKRGSEIGLAITLGMIYIPKGMAIMARKRRVATVAPGAAMETPETVN